MAKSEIYNASDYGKDEEKLINLFNNQLLDSKLYFINCIKPRLDRSYKLYIADNSDRKKEIQGWQANVAVPYVQAVVETLKPRIMDARPDFSVIGRTIEDQEKAYAVQNLLDYTWEIGNSDATAEMVVSSSLIYGMGFMQAYWKKDKRTQKFLSTKDIDNKKYIWKEKTQTFFDAPYAEWIDNYSLWYDWHNTDEDKKEYWFKRLLLTEEQIKRKYPMYDKRRMEQALKNQGDLTDYAQIRTEVKKTHERITKGSSGGTSNTSYLNYSVNFSDPKYYSSVIKLYEVFEWLRPIEDSWSVMVGGVPILKGAAIPNPYDFKESIFVGIPYLKLPGEYEGYGLPMILENPQILLNTIKNQRIDAATLNIHKMWVVNPMANVNKEELVARPFGIIYSPDPNGVREIQTSDIKPSSYREEELLKGDMRYSSGVDDFSMGVGGSESSATAVRHLRESTLERVRLFINHLGDGYSKILRFWLSMWRQFGKREIVIRVLGENGEYDFPIIDKDDLTGEYDLQATVVPSIAGMIDVKKKQDMDLYQLLVGQPFIDPEKLTAKVLRDWNWNIQSVSKQEEVNQPEMGMGNEVMGGMGQEPSTNSKNIPPQVVNDMMAILASKQPQYSGEGSGSSPLNELGSPVNLLGTEGEVPPTPAGVREKNPAIKTTNPRGLNAGGKVNTNIPIRQTFNPEASLMNKTYSIQRKNK